MSGLEEGCLLCLRDANSATENDPSGEKNGHSSPKFANKRREIMSVALCQLVTHPRFEGSIPHQNIIDQHQEEPTFALCEHCAALTEDATEIADQIGQLQVKLRGKIVLIRGKILDSDGERWNMKKEGGAFGCNLERLLPIRQTLLRLSDEDDNFLSSDDIQVKVKIEMEEDDHIEDQFLDACSPSAFLLHPDENQVGFKVDIGDEDSDPLFITPQKQHNGSKARRGRRIKIENAQSADSQTPIPRKQGRPRKTPIAQNHNSTKKRRKVPKKMSSSSSDEIESESENSEFDPLEMLMDDNENGGTADYKCSSCARSFKSEEVLNNHVLALHRYSCQICDKRFRTQGGKNSHEKLEHEGVTPNQCTLCKRKFLRKGSLRAHMFIRHESKDKPFKCSKCDKRFTLSLNLDRHLELHKVENYKPLVCEVCDSRFQDMPHLERHAATHNKKSFICNYCNQSYSSKSGLSRHQRIHTGEKPYHCDQCEETFIDKAAKQWHVAKLHSTPDQHHLCPICGKSFFSAYILKAHLNRHAGVQNVTCEQCGEKFSDTSSLKTHSIQKHDDEPLICDECGAKFMTGKGLKQHKMSHAGLKPHKCDVCDSRFLSKWVLMNHMRSHTGERPFQCDHCGKAFKAKKHLDTHVKSIHSADYVVKTPFVCSFCGKSFPRKGILDGHTRQVHTGERPFICQVCNKGFALNTTLRLHLKSHGINVSKRGPRLPRSKRETFSPPSPVIGRVQRKHQNSSPSVASTNCNTSPTSLVDNSTNSNSSEYVSPHAKFPAGHVNPANNGSSHNNNNGNLHAPSSSFFNPSLSHYYQL